MHTLTSIHCRRPSKNSSSVRGVPAMSCDDHSSITIRPNGSVSSSQFPPNSGSTSINPRMAKYHTSRQKRPSVPRKLTFEQNKVMSISDRSASKASAKERTDAVIHLLLSHLWQSEKAHEGELPAELMDGFHDDGSSVAESCAAEEVAGLDVGG